MRLRASGALLLLLLGILLAACGGGGDEEDAKGLLKTAFSKSIKSADVSFDAQAKLEGIEQVKDPITLKLSGPYRDNGNDKLPGVDFKGNVAVAGQSFSFGFTSTGDNAYVTVQGTSYEVGEQMVAELNKQLSTQKQESGERSLGALGIKPLDWIENAKDEGEEDVAGAKTTHIRADLDVAKLLDDLNEAIDKAPTGAGTPKPTKLTEDQKKQIAEVVKDPKIDVYVAKDDETLRRLSVDLRFEVPESSRSQVGGLQGGTLSISIEFANVGGDQTIEPPADARPLEELGGQLGGLQSGSGGSGSGSGSSGGGSSSDDVERFERYSDCLKKAGADDAKAIEKCAAILNG
jgi:hypothetical protein